MGSEYRHIPQGFGPVFDGNARVLVLGSFPSVRSRQQNFYYGHPQNRFWKVVAALYDEEIPGTIEEKKWLITGHGLALWGTIASCEITGSSDASIRDARANDLSVILDHCQIRGIYCNGRKSYDLYQKYVLPVTGRDAVCLPSTSPANARWRLPDLIEAWAVIRTEADRS